MKGIFKRVTACILAMALVLALCGCAKGDKGDSTAESEGIRNSADAVVSDKKGTEDHRTLTSAAIEEVGTSTGGTVSYYGTADGSIAAEPAARLDSMLMSESAALKDGFSAPMAETDGYGSLDEMDALFPISSPSDLPDGDYEQFIEIRAGLLTAGEWNDNRNFGFLKSLLANGQQEDYSAFFKAWEITPFNRIAVHVSDASEAVYVPNTVSGGAVGVSVANAKVELVSDEGELLWTACTDVSGMAYTFYNVYNVGGINKIPASVRVLTDDTVVDYTLTSADFLDDAVVEVNISSAARTHAQKALDLMFMVDTTGSMGDEIEFLKVELEDIVARISKDNANMPIRLSVNFYRDMEDDYVVRSYPFSTNIDSQISYLRMEYADGGGDFEEAVEMAIDDGVNNHDWAAGSTKLMFLVLDAPAHNTAAIRESLHNTLANAAAEGIRIIPVASSGIDKGTEFFLRSMAITTGGTYTFLTDDSGIGGSHIEPTVGSYDVEYLNDLIVRLVNEYLK